jgi:outer membrane receptor for ferrienterochelin and colicins
MRANPMQQRVIGVMATLLLAASAAATDRAWDFNLPALDGSRFVRASSVQGPVLVNFWGSDCPPCVEELPRLQAFAADRPAWTVWLVATDPAPTARAFVERHAVRLPVLRAGQNVTGLMRAAGNRDGGLPFTVALQQGRICAVRTGTLTSADLAAIEAACTVVQGDAARR